MVRNLLQRFEEAKEDEGKRKRDRGVTNEMQNKSRKREIVDYDGQGKKTNVCENVKCKQSKATKDVLVGRFTD